MQTERFIPCVLLMSSWLHRVCKRKNIVCCSQRLHFQNTEEVKAYPLEVCRMSPRFVLEGSRAIDYVTSTGFWNRFKTQAGHGATITLPAQAFGRRTLALKTCLNVLKHRRCFPCDQTARAMARAIWSSGRRRGSSCLSPYRREGRAHTTNLEGPHQTVRE